MLVLGIESTCDETAASVVSSGKTILSQVVSSQIDLHTLYGGVVPELACRRHMEVILPVVDDALVKAEITIEEVDLIAVSYGPGLVGPLLIGINTAKGLALALQKPIVAVNHIEAHLYAVMMSGHTEISFPALGVILSGGHTAIVLINNLGDYLLIGQTADDAVGEAFDKVAKILGLPYPGGPEVEALAKKGDSKKLKFRSGACKDSPFNFSFSGLKTAVLYAHKKGDALCPQFRADICAAFQETALNDILLKVSRAAEAYNCRTVLFGGGVTNNLALRKTFEEKAPELRCLWPTRALSLDNASMIAGLGYHIYRQKGPSDLATLDAKTRIPFNAG